MENIGIKTEINKLITLSKISEAINNLLDFCKRNNKDASFLDALVLLKSDYNSLSQDYFEKLITDSENEIKNARLKKRLQTILNQINDVYLIEEQLEGNVITGISEINKDKLNFFGRVNESIELQKEINQKTNKTTFPIIQINGIGGIGKTSLMLNFLAKNRTKYRNIAWIRVYKNNSFLSTITKDKMLMAALNYKLDYPNQAYIDREIATQKNISVSNLNEKIDYDSAKKKYFEKYNTEQILSGLKTKFAKPNLLVIDFDKNLEGFENEETLNLLNEISDKWTIVLLSRNKIENVSNFIELKGLLEESAFLLFSKFSPNTSLNSEHITFFELVKYHPLAIKMAALQIKEGKLLLSNLIQNYRTQGLAQLDIVPALEYFLSLSKLTPYEDLILSLFALFPAKEFEINELQKLGFGKQKLTKKQIKSKFPNQNTTIKQSFEQTLSKLAQKAWVAFENKKYQMHPLIQETIRNYDASFVNDCMMLDKVCNILYEKIDEAFLDDFLSIDYKFLNYLEYADYLITHINRKSIKPEMNGFILSVKNSYYQLSKKSDTIRFIEHYIEVLKNQGHSDKGTELVNHYFEIISLAEDEENESYFAKYSKNIVISLKNNTYDVIPIAQIYKRRGSVNLKYGNLDEALEDATLSLKYFNSALAKTEEEAITLSQNKASAINNVGCILAHLSKYKEAKNYIEKAFYENKNLYDYESYQMAWSYTNMGVIEYNLKHYESANLYFKEVLEISKVIFLENNFQIAIFYSNFAAVSAKLKNFDTAIKYIDDSTAILKSLQKYRKSDLLVLLSLKLEIYLEMKNLDDYSNLLLEIQKLEQNKEKFIYFFQSVMYL